MDDKINSKIRATGYHYTQGWSWIAAGEVLNQPNIKKGVPLPMYYDTRRVLSFLLAWRQFPLFNGMSGRSGQWIAFGVDRMRTELGIRAERVRLADKGDTRTPAQNLSCIVLLEQLGIIQCEHLNQSNSTWPTLADLEQLRLDATMLPPGLGGGPNGYFNRHSFQSSSLFYRLADWLDLSELEQPFNPFLSSIESDLEQAGSNLSQTWVRQRTATQASPKPDSSLREGLWFSKDGYMQPKVDLSKVFRLEEVCYEKEALTSPNESTSLAQTLYQLLHQFHLSLANYAGSGMSEAKALELANRWVAQALPLEQVSNLISRLVSDWSEGQGSIYSPVGVLIKRLETALDSNSGNYSRRVNANSSQAFYANKTVRSASQKPHNHKIYHFPRLGGSAQPEISEQTTIDESTQSHERNRSCPNPSFDDREQLNPDEVWQQTLEKLNTRLTPVQLQSLESSRLEIMATGEEVPIVRLAAEWELRQFGQVDFNVIRLALSQFLGQQAWKLEFTSTGSK